MKGHVLHVGSLQGEVPGEEATDFGREECVSKFLRLAPLL